MRNSDNEPKGKTATGKPALFHYSNFFGLSGIASTKSIWCTKIQYLNDYQELKHGMEILAREAQKSSAVHPFLAKVPEISLRMTSINLFVSSFSENGDVLSQWRGYAGGGGVSIGLSFEALQKRARQQNYLLKPCVYDHHEKLAIAGNYLENCLEQSELDSAGEQTAHRIAFGFLQTAASFKDPGFQEENEWRLISPVLQNGRGAISARPTEFGLVPYTSFSLATGQRPLLSETQPWRNHEYACIEEVKIGPNKEQELQMSSVGDLFDGNQVALMSATRSSIPYRSL